VKRALMNLEFSFSDVRFISRPIRENLERTLKKIVFAIFYLREIALDYLSFINKLDSHQPLNILEKIKQYLFNDYLIFLGLIYQKMMTKMLLKYNTCQNQ